MKMLHDVPSFNDVRNETVKTRLSIGFNEKRQWQDAEAIFDDHTLTINGHPVMEDWEEAYMRQLAGIASRKGGVVLEVGFGMGISAQFIQAHPIEEHVIIEANKGVYRRLEIFAVTAPRRVRPMLGFWEEVTQHIESESISGILFDTYPLTQEEIHRNHFPFFKEAYRLLRPGGTLTYYSDEIDDFSDEHRAALNEAQFTRIDKEICRVAPPQECKYWKTRTILAPIVTK